MNNNFAERLNEVGFEHRGERVEVVDFETFHREVESMTVTGNGSEVPTVETTRMGRLHLADGSIIEMDFVNLREMVNYLERGVEC